MSSFPRESDPAAALPEFISANERSTKFRRLERFFRSEVIEEQAIESYGDVQQEGFFAT
jgi:hypothetical protein